MPIPPQQSMIANKLCVVLCSDDRRRWSVAKLADLIGIGPRSSRRKQTLQRALAIATAWFKDHGYDLHASIEDDKIAFAFTLATEPAAVKMRHQWLAEASIGSGGPRWMADLSILAEDGPGRRVAGGWLKKLKEVK